MFGTTRFSEPARTFDTPERRLQHLESLFENTTPLLKAAIASTSPAAVVQTRLYERDGASRWSKGRVTLLGDAAHCMYPSLGLGISTAFQDAVELANCLSSDGGKCGVPMYARLWRDTKEGGSRRVGRCRRVRG